MFNIIDLLENLRRPKILVRAAKLGLQEYNRETHLKKITRSPVTGSSNAIIDRLLVQENTLEDARRKGDASYNVQHHIRVLTAVLAEARLLLKRQSHSA